MQHFTKLAAWRRSHALVTELYRLTRHFPNDELYGLRSQLRRAAVSVPTNLAEGSRRDSDPEYAHFVGIALGSLSEVEYLVMLSRELDYVEPAPAEALLREIQAIGPMLMKLRQTLRAAS